MIETVLALSILALPMFYWHQNELARMIPLIFIAGISGIIALVHGMNTGLPLIWDYSTIALICFSVWLIGSMSWTDSHQSLHECFAWLSMLFLCYLSRYADSGVILGSIFASGVGFAIPSIYYYIRKETNPSKRHFVFGNRVHNAAFTILPLFISLWAAINIHPLYSVASLVLLFNLYLNISRGAIIGTITGLIVVSILLFNYYALLWLALTPLFFLGKWYAKRHGTTSFYSRLIYWVVSGLMIKRRYLFGYGLNMFRKVYPELNPVIFESEFVNKLYKKHPDLKEQTGHRPHNDLLEITVELGVLGLIIFCSIFYNINWSSIDPLFIGGFVAYAVMGLFFFPLREVHTAIGFWAFTGVLMGSVAHVTIDVNLLVGVTLILLIARVLFATGVKFTGLYFFDRAMDDKFKDEKEINIRSAIACDPYHPTYMMYGFLFHVEKDPTTAFEYALRQVSHYSGGKVRWGTYDQFARAVMRLSGINISEYYVMKALKLCPSFEPSQELLGFIHATREKMMKMQNTNTNEKKVVAMGR